MTLRRDSLAIPSLEAARGLLGARLVREDATGRRVGRIVELEAYIGTEDRASHARSGPTPRNAVMFGPPGIAYVYLVYGMHYCLNVVTEPEGRAAALLVRGVVPLEGVELMQEERVARLRAGRRNDDPGRAQRDARRIAALPASRLASGPALVAAAFGLDRSWTGVDLCDPISPLRLEPAPADEPAPRFVAGPRIGIAYAGEPWTRHPWRFVVTDEQRADEQRADARGTDERVTSRPPG
jgi:DNA-3-methyladenine glycosylase